jgi:phage replication O-like protein O
MSGPLGSPSAHLNPPKQIANLETQKGFIKIDNDIAQALMRRNLSKYQSRILWAIFRKTFGFNKDEDWISNSQLVEMTGIHKAHISRTIKELLDRNIVTKRGNKIGFQKDNQQWRELPKGVTSHHELPRGATPLPKGVTKVTKGGGHKRRQYTKDIMLDSSNPAFEEFYKAYPKKKARRGAEKAWAKLNPSPELIKTILTALEKQKQSEEWKKENGKYIPYPATWLNGRRWEDEIPEVKTSKW